MCAQDINSNSLARYPSISLFRSTVSITSPGRANSSLKGFSSKSFKDLHLMNKFKKTSKMSKPMSTCHQLNSHSGHTGESKHRGFWLPP